MRDPSVAGTSSAGAGGDRAATGQDGSASPGCGAAAVREACSNRGSPCHIDIGGTDRTYYVYLPSNYSASQQYPLVFQFHPLGGSAEQAIGIPNIRSSFPAIYVTPQGLAARGDSAGWANTNGQDIELTKALVSTIEASYCVDKTRIFSTGFSYGGMMSFAVACEMGDVFRAIAPLAGSLYSSFDCAGTGPAIAMWGAHGLTDNVVPIADGRKARDKVLLQNHCGSETVPSEPSPCVAYQGCDPGFPTVWCEFDGMHTPPSFAAKSIVTFFEQF